MPSRFAGASDASSSRLSRRRALALAGGATALALVPLSGAARQGPATPAASPAATPTTTAPTLPSFPLPSTLAADASPDFRTVVEAVTASMQRHAVPGVAIGILAGGREEHATVGVASLSSLEPVVPETRFQIGSLTKTFTATAIWHLNDRGAIAIDDAVRTYLPDLRTADPEVADAVQIGTLLDHTAGWYGDEGFDTGDDDDAIARYVAERLPELPQQFPLGRFFSYNNAGFTLLGRVIEVTTGTAYNSALGDLVLGPLGLSDTVLERAEVLRHPYADGHFLGMVNDRIVATVQTPLWVPRSVDPAGGIWSTSRDVIRYARFHLAAGTDVASSGAAVVSAESLLQMREPVAEAPGLPISMGRNWFVQEVDGTRVLSHNGDTLGQHTEFFAIPELGIAFVLMANSSGGAIGMEAVDAFLAAYPGLGAFVGKVGIGPAVLAAPDAPTVVLPRETLDEYAGTYADGGASVKVSVDGDGLTVDSTAVETPGAWGPAIRPGAGTPARVTFTAKDAGVARGVLRLPFVRDDAGTVGWLSSGLRLIPRVD